MSALTTFIKSLVITAVIALVGGVAWVVHRLRERVAFLEHEVRWLRNELENVKFHENRRS